MIVSSSFCSVRDQFILNAQVAVPHNLNCELITRLSLVTLAYTASCWDLSCESPSNWCEKGPHGKNSKSCKHWQFNASSFHILFHIPFRILYFVVSHHRHGADTSWIQFQLWASGDGEMKNCPFPLPTLSFFLLISTASCSCWYYYKWVQKNCSE